MLLFSVESSCDETSVAVVEMSETVRAIRACKTSSQIDIHKLYGGVVPEIASRAHAEVISSLAYEALAEAGVTMADIDAVAVTAYPGLIGALLVGVNFAKGVAASYHKPLIPVNHICGHIAANYLSFPALRPPFLALTISGGHTSLIDVRGYTDFHLIGRTRDDAAGEAFDKVARVMGIPYPGGAEMDRLASCGNPHAIHFPSAAIAGDTLDLSFSGLKTAVINYLHTAEQRAARPAAAQPDGDCTLAYSAPDVAASFTYAVTESLTQRAREAVEQTGARQLVLAGGVAANSHLRNALGAYAEKAGISLYLPPLSLCGDNAAMIGAQGYFEYLAGHLAGSDLNASATCELRHH